VDDVDQAWTTICALLADAELVASGKKMGGRAASYDRRPFLGILPARWNVESIGTLAA
jgi:hypothetical protein